MIGKKRLEYIDQAKGVGMFFIVLGHISSIYGPISMFGTFFKISIFFVISGYLHAENGDFSIAKKTKQFLIPYYFWSFVVLLIELLKALVREIDISRIELLLLKILSFRGISTLWFLPVLLVTYFFHKLSSKWKLSYKYLLLVVLPFLVIMLSNANIFYNQIQEEVSLKYGLHCFAMTLLKGLAGYWFFECSYIFSERVIKLNKNLSALCIVGGGMMIVICGYETNIDFNNLKFGRFPFLFFVAGLIISFAFIHSLKIMNKKFRVLQFMGRNSLFIMCTHLPLNIVLYSDKFLNSFLPKPDMPNINYYIYVMILFIIVLFIEYLFVTIWKWAKEVLMSKFHFSMVKYL